MNSYNLNMGPNDDKEAAVSRASSGQFQEGDFLVRFHGCGTAPQRDCEKEMQGFYESWQKEVRKLDSKQSS